MNRKLLILTFGFMVLISVAFVSSPDDDVLTRIAERFMSYQAKRPIEKVFLHLDKPYYATGEDMWFKAYLIDGLHQQLDSSVSKVMYVELMNSDHKIIERHALSSPQGIAIGDFHLPDSLPQGNYLVRAYTNYMKNFGEDYFFTKEISIFNIGSKPVAENVTEKMDLQFFPEGGNLIAGTENRVAFKAINTSGKGIDVQGEVVDESGAAVASFAVEHKGMGSFKFTPVAGRKYKAKVKQSGETFSFPEVSASGFAMQVTEAGPSFRVSVSSPTPAPIIIVAQSRGEIYFAARGEIKGSPLYASLPKNKFPTGIAQITIFDANGVPQCERLVFVNHDQNTRVKVTPDKAAYGKREPVQIELQAVDPKNQPVRGNFSMAIYDETTIPDVNKYEATIADYFLLTSDLAGKVEEPGYYLKDRTPETVKNLDLLMLTHGWRRFTWKEILKDEQYPLAHYAEQGIRLSGTVVKSIGQKPAAKAKLKVFTSKGDLVMIEADENGKFYTEDLAYYDSMKLAIQLENEKGKQTALKLTLDPYNESPKSDFHFSPFRSLGFDDFLAQAEYQARVQKEFAREADAQMLQGVEITATRIEEWRRPSIYGKPSATITSKDIRPGAMSIFQAMQGKIAGVIVRGSPPNMQVVLRSGNNPPLYLLDGTVVDSEVMNSINPSDVEYIDIIRGTAAAIYGSRGMNGAVAVYMKKGENSTKPTVGMERVRYPGFYKAREFYMPKYDNAEEDRPREDIRSTLYWNPSIETDEQGKATVTFFTSDVLSKYKIVVQGMTYDGKPGVATQALEIR